MLQRVSSKLSVFKVASVVALFAALGVLAGAAASASAHTSSVPSTVSLAVGSVGGGQNEETVWWGSVNSGKPSCEADRKVKLFRDTALTGPDTHVGTDRKSDDTGYWQINVNGYPPPDGTYYAKLSGKVLLKTSKHSHSCARARSNELVVPGPDIDYDGDGYFISHGDCDDDNAAVNPGATEVNNSVDDDCDGQIDETLNPNDQDGDGVENATDNCPEQANSSQEDADMDNKGDVCDACPQFPNPGAQPCPESRQSLRARSG